MAVGSNLLIYATLLVATRFLVLHFLIHRTDYMCNHDHFILQATSSSKHSAQKIFKPNIGDRLSIPGRKSKFRSPRDFTGINRLLIGLILLTGDIATHPGPSTVSVSSKASIKSLVMNARSLKSIHYSQGAASRIWSTRRTQILFWLMKPGFIETWKVLSCFTVSIQSTGMIGRKDELVGL